MNTIRDIAERASVSVSTASLALNGDPRVREETRARVLQVAEELRYRPMRAARSLSSGKTWSIDVINPATEAALTSSFNTRFLHGIHETARREHYTVALQVVDDEEEALASVERSIAERATDGVVLMNPSENEALLERLERRSLAHVLLGRAPQRDVLSVDNDNEAAAFDATAHLLERGLGPVLFLSGPIRQTFAQDRLRGYRRALEASGAAGAGRTLHLDGTAQSARSEVRDLLQDGTRIRSVLALSDALAIGAMRGVRDAGALVPSDVAVMGMNNDDVTDYTDPRLSSVELGAFELGRCAAALLLEALRGGTPRRRAIVPHRLVIREST